MRYLLNNDYEVILQSKNLNEIISSNQAILIQSELTAIEEIKSHLIQKYDFGLELTNMSVYDNLKADYTAGERVYLDANTWVAGTYNLNNLALYEKKVYKCLNTTVLNPTNSIDWQLLGNQYQVFNFVYPKDVFQNAKYYVIGDQIYYLGKTYTCIKDSIYNLPTDSEFWQDNGAYSIPTNSVLNTTYTSDSDNRCKQLVYYITVICVYLLKRISPKNTPEWIEKEYQNALNWCNDAKTGNITVNLPLYSPKTGKRIKIGSNNLKNINNF